MRMFGDDDVAELNAQLARILSRGSSGGYESVEDQARRDLEEVLSRRGARGGSGSSQELLGDAANLVKVADGLASESSPSKSASSVMSSPDSNERMATALENIQHMIGAVVAKPSMGARTFAWMSQNPWRVATIFLVGAGAVGLYMHYAPKKKR